MKSLIALVFALSMMVPVAANAGWGVIAVDDQVGEKDPAYGVGGGDSKAEASQERHEILQGSQRQEMRRGGHL